MDSDKQLEQEARFNTIMEDLENLKTTLASRIVRRGKRIHVLEDGTECEPIYRSRCERGHKCSVKTCYTSLSGETLHYRKPK